MQPPIQGDAKRQADDAIRGYFYQFHQTLSAWLDLFNDPNGIIFIEAAEDFDVQTDASVELNQVRDTKISGPISLSNKKIRDFLSSYYSFKAQRPDLRVVGRYLTTSSIAKEQTLDLPDDAKGIEYWNLVTRGQADPKPLFDAVKTLDLGSVLKTWLSSCSQDEFVKDLACCVEWCTDQYTLNSIIPLIHKKLVSLGLVLRQLPDDSKRAYAPLLAHVATVSSQSENRQLDQQALLEVFESSVRRTIPAQQEQAFQDFLAIATQEVIKSGGLLPLSAPLVPLDKLPAPRHSVVRKAAISDIVNCLKDNSAVILKGSTGTGKSTLAHQIAKRIHGNRLKIYHIDLRDASMERVSASLSSAINIAMTASEAIVFVLDDLDLSDTSFDYVLLSVLLSSVRERKGYCLITSHHAPTATRLESVNLNENTVYLTPYFSESEVKDLISLHNGNNSDDDGMWANVIHIFSTFGHPQLVHALVLSLKQKGWPKSEISQMLLPAKSKAISEQKTDARKRLIASTPTDPARILAYRLSLLIGYFSRRIAVMAGSIDPKIESPGDAFDVLVGPWIEERYGNRYTVSPLLAGAAIEVLNDDEVLDFHFKIASELLKLNPIDVRDFQSAIIHAVIGKNTPVIVRASQILLTKLEESPVIAEGLWMLPMLGLDDGNKLYPENESASSLLRIAQFSIATKLDDEDRAISLGHKMLMEARLLKGEKAAAQLFMSIFKYLSQPELPVLGAELVDLCLEANELLESNPALEEVKNHLTGLPSRHLFDADVSLHQMFFAMGVARLPSLTEFEFCIDRLGELAPTDREDLLGGLQIGGGIDFLFVHRGWITEHQRGNTNYDEWVKVYEHACRIFRSWPRNDLALEATICISVIQDEYIKDQVAAVRYLDDLPNQEDQHPIALHQRAKVLSNNGKHQEAHDIWKKIETDIQSFDGINAVFALRLAAISAAEVHDWPSAVKRYQLAIDATDSSNGATLTMRAGLVGDLGLAYWNSGLIDQALTHLHGALKTASQIDENESLNAHHTHALLGHAVGWAWNDSKRITHSEGHNEREVSHPFINGMCSNPSPHPDIKTKILVGSQHTRLLLASVENLVGSNHEIRSSYFEEYGNTGSALTYSEDCYSRATRSIIDTDIDLFRESVIPFVIAMIEAQNRRENKEPIDLPMSDQIDFPILDNWVGANERELGLVIHLSLTFLTMSMLKNEDYFDHAYTIAEYLKENWKGDSQHILRVLDLEALRESSYQSEDSVLGWAYTLAKSKIMQDSPGDSLIFYFNAVSFFHSSLWRNQIGYILANHCRTKWQHFVTQAAFLLNSPSLYKEDIMRACQSEGPTGLGVVAKILIASTPAAGQRLSRESLDFLQKLASD